MPLRNTKKKTKQKKLKGKNNMRVKKNKSNKLPKGLSNHGREIMYQHPH